MRRFKSITRAQRFLDSHAAAYNLFNLHRHSLCRRTFKLFRLRSFPAEVRRVFDYEIMRLQQGLRPNHYRPMTKAIGPGVAELKVKHRGELKKALRRK